MTAGLPWRLLDMNERERTAMAALALLGRGTFEFWADALAVAPRACNHDSAEYLISLPGLAEHLEDGLDIFEGHKSTGNSAWSAFS